MNESYTSSSEQAGWPPSIVKRWPLWLPPLIAAFYPYLLDGFHLLVARTGVIDLAAALLLLAAFGVPVLGFFLAYRASAPGAAQTRARRLGLLLVAAPTLYTFAGVNLYMLGSPVADGWVWTPVWLLLAAFMATWRPNCQRNPQPRSGNPTLRVLHGLSGLLVAVFIAFHLFNHLFGLLGAQAHAEVMELGRSVYRIPLIEALLVAALLFQAASGMRLAWQWSSIPSDFYRLFQVASGVFLAVFIVGHMNSVFVFARTWGGFETDWAFATGAPTGLILDPWNIRLVPHYALGVFFILAHLFSGLRMVMLAHGASPAVANRLWWAGATISALITLAIILGMIGLRLN